MSHVIETNLYVLKSGQATTVDGEHPERLEVARAGFTADGWGDRELVVVDEELWTPATQRGWGNPATSKAVQFRGDSMLATVQTDIQPDHLAIRIPGHGQFEIGTEPIPGKTRVLSIFGKEFPCIDQGDAAARFFERVLGRPVRLVRADHDYPRVLPERYHREGASNEAAGHDGHALSLMNAASWRATLEHNGIDPRDVPANRFRMSIAVDDDGNADIAPFDEDFIRRLNIGNVAAFAVNATMRCAMTNVDQATGRIAAVGGLRALRGRTGMNRHGERGVFFGIYLNPIPVDGQSIAVGDPIRVEEVADSRLFQPVK